MTEGTQTACRHPTPATAANPAGHGQEKCCAPCPLCAHPEDSGPHILGGCKDEEMHSIITKRHNQAVQIIMRHIARGTRSGGFALMDATAQSELPTYVAGNHPPRWMFDPHNCPSDEDRKIMRPDILYIPSLPLQDTQHRGYRGPTTPLTVYILEVGYTSDWNHAAKKEVKDQQHARLASYLTAAGWDVKYASREAITLGFAGTIHKDLRPLLTELGVRNPAACAIELHHHAIRYLNVLVRKRRVREPGGLAQDAARAQHQREGQPPRRRRRR